MDFGGPQTNEKLLFMFGVCLVVLRFLCGLSMCVKVCKVGDL